MNNLYHSPFLSVDYDAAHSFIAICWLEGTREMTEEEFKYEVKSYLETLKKHPVKRILNNLQKMEFGISPDLQTWYSKQTKNNEMQPEKIAMLMPKDFISELGFEQTREIVQKKRPEVNYKLKYFENEEEARNWVLT